MSMFFKNQLTRDKTVGAMAENCAIEFLRRNGLKLIARNYRPAGRGMADLDAVMLDHDQTVVFVEIRLRSSQAYGGAAASISTLKKCRLIQAASYFLMCNNQRTPACRFDVVVFENGIHQQPLWIQNAFEANLNGCH